MATTVADHFQEDPWYTTARFWKRFSVYSSIALSAASLILTSIASLSPQHESTLNAIKVAGVVVNSISIVLSAATSLDWKKQDTHDKQFANQLLKVTHTHEGNNIVITDQKILRDHPRLEKRASSA